MLYIFCYCISFMSVVYRWRLINTINITMLYWSCFVSVFQIRKPPTVGTSRRGRPPLSRPPGSMTGRGRAKANPYSNYFPNPFGNLDAASIGYLQTEFMRQMIQGYNAALPGMSGVSAASPLSSIPGISPMVNTSPIPPTHSIQKITKSRPSLSVTPIVPPKSTPPKHNTNKTVKKLLEQSRKMLETAGRMQQQPRKMSPLPHFPPGIVASIAKPSTSTPMSMTGPPPAKKPLLSQSSPLTLTKLPSGGRNSPLSLVKQQRSSPVEIIKKPAVQKMPPPRQSVPQQWPSSIPKHMQRAMPHKKQSPPPHLQAPGGPRPMGSAGPSKPQPAHMASRSHAFSSAKDFHFPSDISVMPTVIQHTKQLQQFEQFNLPSSISVSPASKPTQPSKVQLPKEQPKRKTSDDVIVLDWY